MIADKPDVPGRPEFALCEDTRTREPSSDDDAP